MGEALVLKPVLKVKAEVLMFSLNSSEEKLHQQAVTLCRQHRLVESQIIEVLSRIDGEKLFRKLGFSSLFQYCTKSLELSESVSYHFITVTRKCSEVKELKQAIQDRVLSVSKASRIVAAMSLDNAVHLIEFAKTHNSRETDFEAARFRGRKASDKVKVIGEDLVQLEVGLAKALYDKLLRAQDLVSSKTGTAVGFAEVLDKALSEYIERHDPVKKAERSQKRVVPKPKLRPNRVRKPLSAATKHAVFHRDGGRCTFHEASGQRCEQERWLDIHHIVPLHAGGSDDPENLTTLCGFHHDLTHQLSLPLEAQVKPALSAPRMPTSALLRLGVAAD